MKTGEPRAAFSPRMVLPNELAMALVSSPTPAYLNPKHPLFPYLVEIIYPQIGSRLKRPRFRLQRLTDTPGIYRLTEEDSAVSVFNKGCFLPGSLKIQKKVGLEREFENLLFLRGLGFDRTPLRVARPLGERSALDFGLFQEWEGGHHLDHYFRRAIFLHEEEPLFSRLELLASFLARLHQITATSQSVDWHPIKAYYYKVLYQLLEEKLLSNERVERFGRFITLWMKRLGESSTAQVLVHGDATPTNFLFPSGGEMVALDLERLKPGDRVWDLGMICGEIKHAYLWLRRDKGGAEPFIRHFLLEYARYFDDPDHQFAEITRRNPFFMAVTELRIARNGYLDLPYRELLINEAEICLEEGYRKTD